MSMSKFDKRWCLCALQLLDHYVHTNPPFLSKSTLCGLEESETWGEIFSILHPSNPLLVQYVQYTKEFLPNYSTFHLPSVVRN